MAVDPYSQMGDPWLVWLAILTLLAAESLALWLWLSARDEPQSYRALDDATRSLAGGGGRIKHGRVGSTAGGGSDAQGPLVSSGRGPGLPNYWPTPRRSHPLLSHARRNLRSTSKRLDLPTPSKLPPPHVGEGGPGATLVSSLAASSCDQLSESRPSPPEWPSFRKPSNDASPRNGNPVHNAAIFPTSSSGGPNYPSLDSSRMSGAHCTPSLVTPPPEPLSASSPQGPVPQQGPHNGTSASTSGSTLGGHTSDALSRAWLWLGSVLRPMLTAALKLLVRTSTHGVECICCAFLLLVVLVIPIEIQVFGPLIMARRPLLRSQPPQAPPPSSPPAPPIEPHSECALLAPFGGGELHVLVVGAILVVGAGLTIAVHHIVASCRNPAGTANTRRWKTCRGRLADAAADRSPSLLDA